MSDGHFNRSLIPTNSYASGVRAGKSQMRQTALLAIKDILEEHLPDLSISERKTIINQLHDSLNRL